MIRHKRLNAAGRPGTSVSAGRDWVGWTQLVADPNAPTGSGGPGIFSQRTPLNVDDESNLPSPWQPGPTGAVPLDATNVALKPPNPPPATKVGSLGVIKEVQSAFVDYKIDAEILADGSGGVASGAVTDFSIIASQSPGYDSDGVKITKFNGKFTFKGTIQIQTKYAADANAGTLECYGRGTTAADVGNRDITIGFHESCHRADYETYLKTNALPDPPAMNIGMKAADYDKAAAAFTTALNQYWKDMKADSIRKTDEVGFTMSHADKTNSCYVHHVP